MDIDIRQREQRRLRDEPAYADIVDYPENLALGDTLFPLLYIYYYGNPSREARIGNPYMFKKGLQDYVQGLSEFRGSDSQEDLETITRLARRFTLMFEDAAGKNQQWMWSFSNAVADTMRRYKGRVNFDPNRPLPGQNYYKRQDSTGKNRYSTLPQIGDNADLDTCMDALRILFENRAIPYDYAFNIRPINIYTGDLAEEMEDELQGRTSARFLGLPARGVFTVNQTSKGAMMYHTFSGTDIKALASLNTSVSELDHLMSFSWSVHKGVMPNRTLGKPSNGGRTQGGRTIAGTMIFAMTDFHPLRDLVPDDYPGRRTQVLNDPDTWKPLVMADDLPPFDIVLVLTNEYGKAAITTLYGVQIVDEGGVYGIDNLVTELSLQYTAVSMDPLMEVELGENGLIDPFNILQGGYSQMFKRREMMAAGVGFSDLEEAYESYYNAIFDRERVADHEGKINNPIR